jgi:hypothetical protein
MATFSTLRPDATSALSDVLTVVPSPDMRLAILSLVQRMVQNIVLQPEHDKYRRVRRSKLCSRIASILQGASLPIGGDVSVDRGAAIQVSFALLHGLGFEAADDQLEMGVLDDTRLGLLCRMNLSLQQQVRAHEAVLDAARQACAAEVDDQFFTRQMAEMYALGFRDRRINFAALRDTQGDVQAAIKRTRVLTFKPGKPPGRRM